MLRPLRLLLDHFSTRQGGVSDPGRCPLSESPCPSLLVSPDQSPPAGRCRGTRPPVKLLGYSKRRGAPRWCAHPECPPRTRSGLELRRPRRARSEVRRYCAANRLNRLGTLTYRGAGCHDPRELRGHVGSFFRALRGLVPDPALPYLWVPE
jgi:hypothetical protein